MSVGAAMQQVDTELEVVRKRYMEYVRTGVRVPASLIADIDRLLDAKVDLMRAEALRAAV